jgi:hypothetical protein
MVAGARRAAAPGTGGTGLRGVEAGGPLAAADGLAAALQEAGARLAAPGIPEPDRSRLRRQFIAICDSAKTPGASPATVRRRLDALIAALEILIADNS